MSAVGFVIGTPRSDSALEAILSPAGVATPGLSWIGSNGGTAADSPTRSDFREIEHLLGDPAVGAHRIGEEAEDQATGVPPGQVRLRRSATGDGRRYGLA